MSIVELVILFMIAAFILLQLRRELGKKQGNEDMLEHRRVERDRSMEDQMRPEPEDEQEQDDPVVTMEADPDLRRAFRDIRRADGTFSPDAFLQGATSAYGMILEGYWQGDKGLLKEFLDDDLYDQFADAIDARSDAGQVMDNKLLDISDAKIQAARMHGSSAEVTVDVKASVMAVTRDGEGAIVDGDDKTPVDYHDRWTFARNTNSDDPNWTLVATAAL